MVVGQPKPSESRNMKEYKIICANREHYESMVNDFKKEGYKRTSNAFWCSIWEKDNEKVVIDYNN